MVALGLVFSRVSVEGCMGRRHSALYSKIFLYRFCTGMLLLVLLMTSATL
jgi:hypothetical protein